MNEKTPEEKRTTLLSLHAAFSVREQPNHSQSQSELHEMDTLAVLPQIDTLAKQSSFNSGNAIPSPISP